MIQENNSWLMESRSIPERIIIWLPLAPSLPATDWCQSSGTE